MGLSETELNNSSTVFLIRKLNGMRAKEKAQNIFLASMFRDVSFYSANQFKRVVKKTDIMLLPGERIKLDLREVLAEANNLEHWQIKAHD